MQPLGWHSSCDDVLSGCCCCWLAGVQIEKATEGKTRVKATPLNTFM